MLPFPLSLGKPGIEAILDMLLRGTMDGLTLTELQCVEVRGVLLNYLSTLPDYANCTECGKCKPGTMLCADCHSDIMFDDE